MLVNVSNHPSAAWPEAQRAAAREAFGDVMDVPFPAVPARARTEAVLETARRLALDVCDALAKAPRPVAASPADDPPAHAAHVMGEMTLVFALVAHLQALGVQCVASTSERVVLAENPATGEKTARFTFVCFRPYPRLHDV